MKSPLVLLYALVLALGAGAIGCGNAVPIYVRTGGGYGGVDLAGKRAWTARGGLANPQAAIDGDLSTIARTARQYDFVELTIDLKEMVLFQMVVIDHGRDEHGHCRRVSVATSVDGKAFADRHEVPGTRRLTILSLPEPVLARYVRLRAIRPGPRPWSIAEVFLQ